MDPDGKNKTQLTKTPVREFSLSAAHQADRIWFVRRGEGFAPLNGGDVYSCDYDGKNVSKVTEGLVITFVAVSVDGQKMAVAVSTAVEADPASYSTSDMWVMDAGGVKQDKSAEHIDLTGDLPASQVGGREGSTFLTWSPQIDQVAFTFKPDDSASLGISTKSVYLAKADGSDRKKLVDGCAEPRFNELGTMLTVTTGAHWDTMGVLEVSVDGEYSEDILPLPTGSPLYSASTPFWLTTYEDIKENPNIFYAKTTHPAEPAVPVTTLEKHRIEGGATTVIYSAEGADKTIPIAWPTVFNSSIVFQSGFGETSSIWSVTAEGKDLKCLSDSPTAGDSEPTSAVSYSWYNKDGPAGGGMQFQACHWPYAENRNWPYQK
jgi:hypothetical protein